MDVFERFATNGNPDAMTVIKTIDMHTSGEATRIILPQQVHLEGGTLLEKRTYARKHMDYVRKLLMREPRGHSEMYGAIIVQDTELTASGEADIAVLFCHNEGYSTMCGHATIALGRFLIDTHDLSIFPRRNALTHDAARKETLLRLHVPCGIVQVRVPTIGTDPDTRSDAERAVVFTSVPSFASAVGLSVDIPVETQWSQLREMNKRKVTVDVAFGGAFYAIVSATELGFTHGVRNYTMTELGDATAKLKALLAPSKQLFIHPESELRYLYGVIVVEKLGPLHELGICFFANQQVDRSPTGSGVCARVALSVAKGELGVNESVQYESIISMDTPSNAFKGEAVQVIPMATDRMVQVLVEVGGRAFYTGAHTFVLEEGKDLLKEGFEV